MNCSGRRSIHRKNFPGPLGSIPSNAIGHRNVQVQRSEPMCVYGKSDPRPFFRITKEGKVSLEEKEGEAGIINESSVTMQR